MRTISLDFSLRAELSLRAEIVGAVQVAATSLGVESVIVGAFARDIHLVHARRIAIERETEDLDFAMALANWTAFRLLRERLIASGDFTEAGPDTPRIRHRTGVPVDLIPIGHIEDSHRHIAWPPRGERSMNVFGFSEALRAAQELVLPGNIRASVISLPALALLKLIAWNDRHYVFPRKDAQDLALILRHYLDAENQNRLFDEFAHWTTEREFDYEGAGARMLGWDIAALLDRDGLQRVSELLVDQSNRTNPGRLPAEIDNADTDRARALLEAVSRGLFERSKRY